MTGDQQNEDKEPEAPTAQSGSVVPRKASYSPPRQREDEDEDDDEDFPPALRSLIQLERERIETTNRRTEVVRFAIETNDASDKRQYEYRKAELEAKTAS